MTSAARTSRGAVTPHIYSVDVEEHFQVGAFERIVPRDEWPRHPSRVERNTDVILELLARFGARGTFFTLGWVAKHAPAIVRRIAEAGHEVASHGWTHRRITAMSPDEVRAELRDSKAILEDVSGQRVTGFRAPNFSIVPGREWAFELLLEEGYAYDASLFPIRRPDYGYPAAPAEPHAIHTKAGTLYELPAATTTAFGQRLPAAGGGYLRQFPYAFIRRAFREHAERGASAMFYVHPWEVDPAQPRIAAPFLTRVRHYRGLHATLPRMERLLGEFPFTSVRERYGAFDADAVRAWPSLDVRAAGVAARAS